MKKSALRNKFKRMNLDAKLRLYTTVLIIVITVVMLSISTTFTVCTLYRKSAEAAESKLSFIAEGYGNWLEGNKNTLLSLQLAQEVQTFCSCTNTGDKTYTQSRSQVLDSVENLLTSNLDINFISVANEELDVYVYRGNHSITNTGYDAAYKIGMEESEQGKEKGSIRVNFGNDFFGGSKYSVTFYLPIYSVKMINKRIGMLCMNINDSLLKNMEQLGTIESSRTYLAGVDGHLISSEESVMKSEWILNCRGREKGCVNEKGRYYFYQKIGGWNYYAVNVVPMIELYESSVKAACIMIGSMVLLLFGSIVMIRKLVHKSYEQVSCIVEGMDYIAKNELDYRIETEAMGEDFEKLGNGFNHMIDEIDKLMRTIREEQYQLDQIRLQALQSQIQPHFLYNTLECIHWQSCAEGNKQVSKLVMALASYYRLSLSKGRDVVSLRDEIAHVQYYLFIQNQRFGELIESEVDVEETLKDIKIPKITLQPLVENAIYHGIGIKEGRKGKVRISACQQENGIAIEIADSGDVLTKEKIEQMNQSLIADEEQFGYGVRNVNKRIQLLFGNQYGINYRQGDDGGAVVVIQLPAHSVLTEHADGGGRQDV